MEKIIISLPEIEAFFDFLLIEISEKADKGEISSEDSEYIVHYFNSSIQKWQNIKDNVKSENKRVKLFQKFVIEDINKLMNRLDKNIKEDKAIENRIADLVEIDFQNKIRKNIK